MKKKILISILIVLSFITAIKLSEIIIMHNVSKSIEQFEKQENRYYSVDTILSEKEYANKKIFLNNYKLKILNENNYTGRNCEWNDFKNGKVIAYNITNKIKYSEKMNIELRKDDCIDLPNIIANFKINNGSSLRQLLKIHYIIPITYENKPCYKISTDFETVIIDKKTYLPVYSAVKTVNSSEGDNITEYFYKFEVGTVTDEDVALPDFSDYTIE